MTGPVIQNHMQSNFEMTILSNYSNKPGVDKKSVILSHDILLGD